MNKVLAVFTIIISAYSYATVNDYVDKFLTTYPSSTAIHAKLRQHEFSCKDLINGYINRIKLYNLTITSDNVSLNSITQINSKAIDDAEKIDIELANRFNVNSHSASSKQLLCTPVIIKDNIDVKGMRTSSGSLSLLGTYPLRDAQIVRNIKSQGGIIIAKSAMDELASGMTGISGLSGRVGNGYNPLYNPGGSSSGSAVAVAAGFAVISIGSDNSGSVRIPAAYNGLYGLRPTYGLISNAGIFPLGNIDGTAGPIATNVSDLARLLSVMVDNKTDYTQNLNPKSLSGKHFAIIKSVAGVSIWSGMPGPISAIYEEAMKNLQKQGAIITEIDLPKFNLDRKNNMSGTREDIDNYFAHDSISSISRFQDVCYGATRIYGLPGDCLKFIKSLKDKNSKAYSLSLQIINKNQAYIMDMMKSKNLSGFILPSGRDGVASYNLKRVGMQWEIASNSALPEITFPIAQYNNLPVGLEIMGAKYAESSLLNYAFAYQENFYTFKMPKLTSEAQFVNWNINKLNMLYPLIGKINFEISVKKTKNFHEISPKQMTLATKKAVSILESEAF